MSVTPENILETAERLARPATGESSTSEADLRSSASRAYYAAMHAADLATPADLAPTLAERKQKDSHKLTIDAIIKWANTVRNGKAEAQFMARNLPRLKQIRKKADYRIDEAFSPQETESALRTARQTMSSALRASQQCAGEKSA